MTKSPGEDVGIDYWMKWQVMVCGLIIAIPAAIVINIIKSRNRNLKESQNSNYLLWLPSWRNLHPKWLLLYRTFAFLSMAFLLYQILLFAGLFALYFYTHPMIGAPNLVIGSSTLINFIFGVFVWIFASGYKSPVSSLWKFLYRWTFVLVMLYFAIGTFVSAQGCLMSSNKAPTGNAEKHKVVEKESGTALSSTNLQLHDGGDESHEGAGILGSLMLIIYQTSAGASVLTDLVFWFILVPMMSGKQFQLTLLIGCIHSLNVVFLVIDALLNALPFEWFGFCYFILWSITYVTFQWILHACGSTWWPYPFLELSTPWAPLWYLGLALIHVPCYGVYYMFVKAKNLIFSKLFERAFVRSHGWILQHHKAA